jgi:hypothetical protein
MLNVRVAIFLILSLSLSEHGESVLSVAPLNLFPSPRRQMVATAEDGAIPDAAVRLVGIGEEARRRLFPATERIGAAGPAPDDHAALLEE